MINYTYFSEFIRGALHRLSYDPHTVQGTWTIIVTTIIAIVGILLALRLLVPVKDGQTQSEQKTSDKPALYAQEAQQS